MCKKIQQLLLFGGMFLLFTNCEKEFFGNSNCSATDGPIVSQTVAISNIHSMDIEVPVELIIKESATQEIIIESSQAVIDVLLEHSFVRNEEWNVQLPDCLSNNNNSSALPIIITASLTSLREIKIDGIGEARTDGVFKNISDLKLNIEGSAEFDFTIDSMQTLETKISGLGEFRLSGYAQNHFIDMSGSGKIKAYDLESNHCQIKMDGTGECEVKVQETLAVEMSGSGTVCYKGDPKVTLKNQGDGQVKDCN